MKSVLRVIGYFTLVVNIFVGVVILVIAEVLGVLEELKDL
jgi:hypothetical protein